MALKVGSKPLFTNMCLVHERPLCAALMFRNYGSIFA